jgi:hypothetical protein
MAIKFYKVRMEATWENKTILLDRKRETIIPQSGDRQIDRDGLKRWRKFIRMTRYSRARKTCENDFETGQDEDRTEQNG